MSDRDGSRVTGDDALGRQIKTNLRGIDSFIPPAPPFAEIESPALRPVDLRGKSTGRARLKLRAGPGLLVAGLVVVVALGSGVWRPSQSAGAGESPTASEVSSTASTTGASEPSLDAKATSPWYAAEVYLLSLMNCTRTGGWVTASGACSSVTHHVMPAQDALAYSSGISNAVSRPYSKALADRGMLTHYLNGTTPHSRLSAAGYTSGSWGENLSSPPSKYASGMIHTELFFQNEYRCQHSRCEFAHYFNIMDPYFHRAGVGIWVSNGHVRLTIDFYG